MCAWSVSIVYIFGVSLCLWYGLSVLYCAEDSMVFADLHPEATTERVILVFTSQDC